MFCAFSITQICSSTVNLTFLGVVPLMSVPSPIMSYVGMTNAPMVPQGMPAQGGIPPQAMAGQPMVGQPMPGQPMGRQPIPGQPMGGQPMGGQPMGGQVMPGQPIAGQVMPGQPMGGQMIPRPVMPIPAMAVQGTPPTGMSPQQYSQIPAMASQVRSKSYYKL